MRHAFDLLIDSRAHEEIQDVCNLDVLLAVLIAKGTDRDGYACMYKVQLLLKLQDPRMDIVSAAHTLIPNTNGRRSQPSAA